MRANCTPYVVLIAVLACLAGCPVTQPPPPPPKTVAQLEAEVIELINAFRMEQGLLPVFRNDIACDVARAHSEDMIARQFESHVNPDGLDHEDRILAAGLAPTAVAENIAIVGSQHEDHAERAVNGWRDSADHRSIILDLSGAQEWTQTGVGVARQGMVVYFTQVFLTDPP